MGQLITKLKKNKKSSSSLMFLDDDYYKIIHTHSEINTSTSNLLITFQPYNEPVYDYQTKS